MIDSKGIGAVYGGGCQIPSHPTPGTNKEVVPGSNQRYALITR